MSSTFPLGVAALSLALTASTAAQFKHGTIFVCDGFGQEVHAIDPDTYAVSVFANTTQGLTAPGSVGFAGGRLLVSDSTTNELYSFDGNAQGGVVVPAGNGLNVPFGENGIAVDAQGRVYVANFGARNIRRFEPGFSSSTVFADAGDGIVFPDGLVFDGAGNLLVANRGSGGQILSIDPAGTATVLDTIAGEDVFSIDYRKSNGDIYVATVAGYVFRYVGGSTANRVRYGKYAGGNVSIKLSPDEQTLYHATGLNGKLRVIDPDTGDATVVASGLGTDIAGIEVIACEIEGELSTYGAGLAGTGGVTPSLAASGDPNPGGTVTIEVRDFVGQAPHALCLGFAPAATPALGGTLWIDFALPVLALPLPLTGPAGAAGAGDADFALPLSTDPAFCGASLYWQSIAADAGAIRGFAMTNGLRVTIGD